MLTPDFDDGRFEVCETLACLEAVDQVDARAVLSPDFLDSRLAALELDRTVRLVDFNLFAIEVEGFIGPTEVDDRHLGQRDRVIPHDDAQAGKTAFVLANGHAVGVVAGVVSRLRTEQNPTIVIFFAFAVGTKPAFGILAGNLDACLAFDDVVPVLQDLAQAVRMRRTALGTTAA